MIDAADKKRASHLRLRFGITLDSPLTIITRPAKYEGFYVTIATDESLDVIETLPF
jgi:hypothetical protein